MARKDGNLLAPRPQRLAEPFDQQQWLAVTVLFDVEPLP
jgi:hypothetical protein